MEKHVDCWLVTAALLFTAPMLGCDPGSKEIGGSVADEMSESSDGGSEDGADGADDDDDDSDSDDGAEGPQDGDDGMNDGDSDDGMDDGMDTGMDTGTDTGTEPGGACDPLGEPCPTTDTSQECEPNAANDGWICVPQYAGTSPQYGDECWPEDQPEVACTEQTVCLSADDAAIASCDGGEGGGCCTQLCDLTDPAPCPDAANGQMCLPYYGDDPVPEGYEHVGICRA